MVRRCSGNHVWPSSFVKSGVFQVEITKKNNVTKTIDKVRLTDLDNGSSYIQPVDNTPS